MVIHIRDAPRGWQADENYVYIGRAGHGLDGYFGNPFRLGAGEQRGATLERYARWLANRMKTDATFAARVSGLKGKTLVCFCKPSACHGDILEYAANRGDA